MDSNSSADKQFGCAWETGISQYARCFSRVYRLVTSHIPLWVGRLTVSQALLDHQLSGR
ncbi:hypothetical protein [Anabaena azotica]|uniref:Uncharacterized protein n=1 Tax=Anabaena azotica FACHB-119 TaxID=947527 RepID=A0ABR8DA14_9NOST|nr:hypothetical protein [Anabaena azotica]MBD2503278.1 hypothetical protein [Anabaena azotica FACHB-119]